MDAVRTNYRPMILLVLGTAGFWLGCSGDSTPQAADRAVTRQASEVAGDALAAPPSAVHMLGAAVNRRTSLSRNSSPS